MLPLEPIDSAHFMVEVFDCAIFLRLKRFFLFHY